MLTVRRATFLLAVFLLLATALAGCGDDVGVPIDARRDTRAGDGNGGDGAGNDIVEMDATDDLVGDDTGGGGDTGDMDVTTMGDGDDVPAPPLDVVRDVGMCTPGAVSCSTADRRRTCLPDGGYLEEDCPAGQVCIEGSGCRVCEPGATRCNADGLTVEACAMDGMSWAMSMRCNSAMGQACEGYRCVDTCARAASQRSYLGCEYWPTVLSNSQMSPFGGAFDFAVTIANPQRYPVTVTISGGALGAARTVTVPAGATQTEALPWVAALYQHPAAGGANSVLARGGAYRLTSTSPIAVYQFNPLQFSNGGGFSYSNDASLLLPTHVLTPNYLAITHNTWLTMGGQVAIVGTSATPTTVMVNLRGSIRGGTGVAAGAAGSTQMYTLNRGDVVMLVGGGSSARTACSPDDLTGTSITATQPVAVYVGHDCTNMPCANTACDHLEEQLFPNETWGRSYVVSALRERGAGEVAVVRILSQVDANRLTFSGIGAPAACATLNARQFCEFEASADFQVTGTGPMLIAQFMVGQDRVAGVGDPAMVLEVPTQQFRTNYVFNVPASYTTNFLTVVYPSSGLPNIDGRPIAAGTAVAGTTFSVSRFSLAPGSHTMVGPSPFGIKVTGTASYTSYMYPGGLDLNQINVR